jgi:hypothetical protein
MRAQRNETTGGIERGSSWGRVAFWLHYLEGVCSENEAPTAIDSTCQESFARLHGIQALLARKDPVQNALAACTLFCDVNKA